MRRVAPVLLGLLGGLLWATPAAALAPPALYVRLANANSIDHTPVSDWMPLAAPTPNWLGGYEIGYAVESPGAQRAALQITGVPDGQATQPLNAPFCTGVAGVAAGSIVPVGVAIQFEGSGVYAVRVGVGPASGGPNDCLVASAATAASEGSFTVSAPTAPAVVGAPLVFRAKRLPDGAFSGVRAPSPPGGEADTRCARDATVNPDGSVTGKQLVPESVEDGVVSQIAERDFDRPGAWTCVARGSFLGQDDAPSRALYGTPWSAPLRLDVRSDFRRAKGAISKPSAKQPTVRFTAEFPDVVAGATGKLTLRRLTGCKGRSPALKTVATFKGTFGADGRATVKLRRPRPGFFYLGTLSFSGTRFITKSVDPNPVLMRVSDKRKLSFVSPLAFPQC